MSVPEQEFTKKLLDTFRIEAHEHLSIMLNGILALEKNPPHEEELSLIETIHREAHSLKGAARAVNLTHIESICKYLEDIFSYWKQQKIKLNPYYFDLLHQAMDYIKKAIAKDLLSESYDLAEVENINKGLTDILCGNANEMVMHKPALSNKIVFDKLDSVRIPVSRMTALLLQAEEMISVKLFTQKKLDEIIELDSLICQCKKDLNNLVAEFERNYIKMTSSALQLNQSTMIEKLSYLLNSQDEKFNFIINKMANLKKEISKDNHSIGLAIDNLLNEAKRLIMMPLASLLNMFPKMIRDLARTQGKTINFMLTGGEIEIDKRILEEIKDALIHIVRNSIDHGIESPDTRALYNKPAEGKISISVYQPNKGEVEIVISDDGQGIDIEAIKSIALHKGLITDEKLSISTDEQVINLIYLSGLTTKKTQDDLSGQGLGMAIVKEAIEKLGGQITINSQHLEGTTIHIILPVTISTFKGILFKVESELFVVPANHVERVIRIHKDKIKSTGNQGIITVDGEVIPLFCLSSLLEINSISSQNEIKYIPILITCIGGKKSAIQISSVLSEIDVCAKNITGEAAARKVISGATVLGNGKVIPILNMLEINKLITTFRQTKINDLLIDKPYEEKTPAVLLVDDSITTRMLLKHIIETAGFSVTTAVDGVDAWSKIKISQYSLIITDIEMPNMDGFELTRRIRQDEKTATLPIIIITTRESQEDRIHGIDAGADAYIVKKGMNDHDLIDVIRELVI